MSYIGLKCSNHKWFKFRTWQLQKGWSDFSGSRKMNHLLKAGHAIGSRSTLLAALYPQAVREAPFFPHRVQYALLRKFLSGVSRAIWYAFEPPVRNAIQRVHDASIYLYFAHIGFKMHPQQKSKQCFYGNRATALNRLQEARDSIAPNMDALRFEAQLRPSAEKMPCELPVKDYLYLKIKHT